MDWNLWGPEILLQDVRGDFHRQGFHFTAPVDNDLEHSPGIGFDHEFEILDVIVCLERPAARGNDRVAIVEPELFAEIVLYEALDKERVVGRHVGTEDQLALSVNHTQEITHLDG